MPLLKMNNFYSYEGEICKFIGIVDGNISHIVNILNCDYKTVENIKIEMINVKEVNKWYELNHGKIDLEFKSDFEKYLNKMNYRFQTRDNNGEDDDQED